jgi:hypothetical protein
LFLTEAGPEIEERIGFVFPVASVGAVVFVCEFGGRGSVEGGAGCGGEFEDEDFEDFEGGRDRRVCVWVCAGLLASKNCEM